MIIAMMKLVLPICRYKEEICTVSALPQRKAQLLQAVIRVTFGPYLCYQTAWVNTGFDRYRNALHQ